MLEFSFSFLEMRRFIDCFSALDQPFGDQRYHCCQRNAWLSEEPKGFCCVVEQGRWLFYIFKFRRLVKQFAKFFSTPFYRNRFWSCNIQQFRRRTAMMKG